MFELGEKNYLPCLHLSHAMTRLSKTSLTPSLM